MIQLHRGFGRPTVFHALIVIFAEFFAWGLLTTPTITALKQTFPGQTLMINGLIWGIKGTLSFLMSPPIGYFSDVFGRKPFLLITVLFTCLPIPVMFISSWWFFIMIALSGMFSVTFSVVFAYVADLTTGAKRSSAYGQVSATFAASLIISPALGSYLSKIYGDNLVILIATSVAILDVLFILFIMPESLPEKLRSPQMSLWEQATPIITIRKIGRDFMIWTLCLTVFLSYLPEAGQYSCFFVYLKLVVGFSEEQVGMFIAFIGILSVLAQTILMTHMIDRYGGKMTILAGLLLQAAQLLLLGFCQQPWMMWLSGIIASLSSITYPAISAYISTYADADKQGLVQGLITGVRSLCGGIGPAMFGLLFNIFDVDMYEEIKANPFSPHTAQDPLKPFIAPDFQASPPASAMDTHQHQHHLSIPVPTAGSILKHQLGPHTASGGGGLASWIVGPPFLFGAILVLFAAIAATFIPDTIMPYRRNPTKSTSPTNYYRYTTVSSSGNFENGAGPSGISGASESADLNGTLNSTSNLDPLEELED